MMRRLACLVFVALITAACAGALGSPTPSPRCPGLMPIGQTADPWCRGPFGPNGPGLVDPLGREPLQPQTGDGPLLVGVGVVLGGLLVAAGVLVGRELSKGHR